MTILRRCTVVIFLCMLFMRSPDILWADEERFTLRAEATTIPVGKQSEIECVFSRGGDVPPPEIPLSAGLVIKYFKSSERNIPTDDGKNVSALVHIYKVIPARQGDFRIGPISFSYKGNTYHADALTVSAVKTGYDAPAAPSSSAPSEKDLAGHIYTVLEMPDGEIFPNKSTPIRLKLFSDWLDLTNIIIADPSSSDLIIRHFEKGQSTIVTINSVKYAVLEYDTTILAASSGTFTINPIQVTFDVTRPQKDAQGNAPELLNANEPFYDSLFSGRDVMSFTLKTEPVQVRVSQLSVVSERQPDIVPYPAGQKLSAAPSDDTAIVGIKGSMGLPVDGDIYFYRRPAYAAAFVLPLILLLVAAGIKKRLNRIEHDPYYAAWRRARAISRRDMAAVHASMLRDDPAAFYCGALLLLRTCLGIRFGIPPEGFTASAIDASVRQRINDALVVKKVVGIFADCYCAQFSGNKKPREMRAVYDDLCFVINYLDKAVYI